ncbi:invasion associated locus B family protein [Allomesorhizobium alhagi]|uniref:Invasion associated locus B family protein n=1 Tax=Mesorhizobium alhagi CCNWXJ12-2 TaxID=1107882 RepID=H0HIV0_9HYPH|nr:invasion associated locus B family protein [Mesorhizobium alhagi]EHK59331.1 invasion associated locus B family protein [Mesorhizobium alhagi CCNWXJ12-2]
MKSSNAGSFSRYAAAMLALAAGTGDLAFAQETPKAEALEKPVNAWVVNCASGASGGALECQMSQNLTEAKTGQRVLTVTIRKQAKDGAMAMLLALPHDLFIPSGASYQIDAGEKKAVAIQTSDQNGAYAAVPLDAALITALKTGTNLNIGMESVTRKPVAIPLSLNGFTAAIDKLDAVQ